MTNDRSDDENNLAIASSDGKPKICAIQREIESALSDAAFYYNRMNQVDDWCFDRWDGQDVSGRKVRDPRADQDPFPWENASDTRTQILNKLVGQHVMVDKFMIAQGKLQAESHRPFTNGQDAAVATRILKWLVYSHMRAELDREYPLSSWWRHQNGCSFLAIKWETVSRTDYVPLSIGTMDELIQSSGNDDPQLRNLLEVFFDPRQEDVVIELLKQISPAVTGTVARKILTGLKTKGEAEVPVPYVYKSKPKWYALRAVVDLLFPFGTSDIQAAPWVAERERVDEVTLRDRIQTEDYDETFVEELAKHKGQADNAGPWSDRTQRDVMSATGRALQRDTFELFHVTYKTIERGGSPCLYRTIFSPLVNRSRKEDNYLYASHAPFPYEHGEYPYVTRRFELTDRPILSSRGIPEISYTHALEIKTQRDARTDRTAIEIAPPLIVPQSKKKAIEGTFGPRAVLGVTQAEKFNWLQLPPMGMNSVEIEKQAVADIDERYALFGAEVDPDLKMMRRQEFAGDVLGEFQLALDQTMKLAQEYEPDDVVQKVAGTLQRPFHQSREAIQGAWYIKVAFDAKMLDEDYAMKKVEVILQAMPLSGGAANMSGIFRMLMGIIEPDFVDQLVTDDTTATEKETNGAEDDVNKALNGIIPRPPMFGNHQLRLQTIGQLVSQPNIQQRIARQPDSQAILQQLITFHQNQIQQFQKNPQIGRTLATKPGDPTQALPTRSPQQMLAG